MAKLKAVTGDAAGSWERTLTVSARENRLRAVEGIAALGVRRISVGGTLALAAWTGFLHASQTLRSAGSFAGLADLVPYAEINGLVAGSRRGDDRARRHHRHRQNRGPLPRC